MQEIQELWVWSLGREDTLEEEMVTSPSIIAWRIPQTEESDGSTGLQRAGHDWVCAHTHVLMHVQTELYIFKNQIMPFFHVL